MDAWEMWRMCGRKAVFRDPAAARRFGRRKRQHPYRCPVCRQWHLTKRGFE